MKGLLLGQLGLDMVYVTMNTYDGFKMIVQPATNAGPILNVTSYGVNEVRS